MPVFPRDSQWHVYQAAICQFGVLTWLFPRPWLGEFLGLRHVALTHVHQLLTW